MLILVLVLVLKDSLRTFSSPCPCPAPWGSGPCPCPGPWGSGPCPCPGPWGSGPCPCPCPWGVRPRRSLSLSWSLGVGSLSLSLSLGVRFLLTSLVLYALLFRVFGRLGTDRTRTFSWFLAMIWRVRVRTSTWIFVLPAFCHGVVYVFDSCRYLGLYVFVEESLSLEVVLRLPSFYYFVSN